MDLNFSSEKMRGWEYMNTQTILNCNLKSRQLRHKTGSENPEALAFEL